MGIIDYKKLPLIDSFDKLERNTYVYSEKYGLGIILFPHKNEIVVAFSNFRKRISPDDHDLREIPKEWLKKRRSKISIEVDGQKMTLSAFKRRCRLEKRAAKFY